MPAAFCIYGLFCQGHSAVNETKRAIVFHSATAINYLKAYFWGTATTLAASQRRLSSSGLVSQVSGTTPTPESLFGSTPETSYLLMPITLIGASARDDSSPTISAPGSSLHLLRNLGSPARSNMVLMFHVPITAAALEVRGDINLAVSDKYLLCRAPPSPPVIGSSQPVVASPG